MKKYVDDIIADLVDSPLFEVLHCGPDNDIANSPYILLKVSMQNVSFEIALKSADDYEYAWEYPETIDNKALVFNGQLDSATISNGIVKQESASNPEYWYIFGIRNGIPTVIADPNHEYTGTQLKQMGFTLAFGVWEILKLNGTTYNISDFSVFSGTSHYTFISNDYKGASTELLWDDDNWYILIFDGRMEAINGLSRTEIIAVMDKYGIPNGVHCDGGGSTQLYINPPTFCVTRIAHSTNGRQVYNERRNVVSLCKLEDIR